MEPADLLAEIVTINKRIREAGRERLELVERFNREIRELVRDFEGTPDTFRVFLDLTRRLQRITRRVEKAHEDQSLDYSEQLEKALTVLKKRRFETAIRELDRIPVLGLLTEQRRLFEEYKKGYAALRTRCESVEAEIREKRAYYESLQNVDVTSFDELAALKEQIAAYNDDVGTLLETFVKQASILDVLRISLDASYHPELGFPPPPSHENAEKLISFVLSEGLTTIQLFRFLEYAKYSDSKLSHYVGDTTSFRQVLESNVVWLESLNDIKRRGALKLSIEEPGVSLAVKIRRLIPFLSKLNAPPGLLTFLRETQKLVTSGRYERIRATSAVNRDHLEKIQQGAHLGDLRALEDERERLMKQLEHLQEPRAVETELT
ncbi:MAG TPA: hypothetical protein VEF35_01665 [Candidatus Bathyarchaeia archaeon]|nr:hypothetical protein [Candidatus Bathyarchaeia archaeon]